MKQITLGDLLCQFQKSWGTIQEQLHLCLFLLVQVLFDKEDPHTQAAFSLHHILLMPGQGKAVIWQTSPPCLRQGHSQVSPLILGIVLPFTKLKLPEDQQCQLSYESKEKAPKESPILFLMKLLGTVDIVHIIWCTVVYTNELAVSALAGKLQWER